MSRHRRSRLVAAVAAVMLLGCSELPAETGRGERADSAAASRGAAPATVDHAPWDAILHRTVRDERVDYQAIATDHAAELHQYLAGLAEVDVARLARDEQLAFYINLYNATMVQAVLDRWRDGYSVAADGYSVFKQPLVRLKGRTVSLDDLEKRILLPTYAEPRLHVALVCGAASCPPLIPRAYRASDLDQVLDGNMRRFINDGKRNRIDRQRRRMQLSQLFHWYAEDFGGEAGVPAYVSRYYEGGDVNGFSIEFLDYSWELNAIAR